MENREKERQNPLRQTVQFYVKEQDGVVMEIGKAVVFVPRTKPKTGEEKPFYVS